MSKKLLIVQALTALLEGVTSYTYTDLAGDEQTATYDLVGRVYRGRKTVSVTDAKESMAILEQSKSDSGTGAGPDGQVRTFNWSLNLQGWPVEDINHPSDPAYLMAAAVEQRLQRVVQRTPPQAFGQEKGLYPEFMLGGLIESMTVQNALVLPPTENLSAVAFFYIPITVAIIRDLR